MTSGVESKEGTPTSRKRASEPEQLGPFDLLEHLGAGGMGEGYLAVRSSGAADHYVFVKRILVQHRTNPEFIRFFEKEASIVAQLGHPNIVTLVEPDPEGRYLAFELVDGLDLKKLLAAQPDRRLPVEHTVFIFAEILKALKYAHSLTRGGERAGVIHRDLTPANVLIAYTGAVKVADFGVATVVFRDTQTMTAVVGKHEYRSPEESDGAVVDQRSDLFSLGVVLYEMLAGQKPYQGTAYRVAKAIAEGRRQPLQSLAPHVPARLCTIIDKLLNPAPADRYQCAGDVEAALYEVHPPNPRLYEDLGDMVKRLQPLRTSEIARLRQRSTRPSGTHAALREAGPLAPSASTAGSSRPEPPSSPAQEDATTAARRVRRRGLRYGMLGAALLTVGVAVTAVVTSLSGSGPRQLTAPTPETARHAAIDPPSQEASPNLGATLSPAAPETTPPALPETAMPAQPPLAAAASTKPGTLHVNAFPAVQVWVDRRLIDWTPIELPLPPGRHEVSIGLDDHEQTETRRTVTLRPGRLRKLRFTSP